jgi:hypothetical protein
MAAHLAAYALLLRGTDAFKREWTIFGYHVLSMALVLVSGATLMRTGVLGVPAVAVAAAVHGIYSLTFLELWALAEGGYSLAILRELHRVERLGIAFDPTTLYDLGSSKRSTRGASLVRLGLCRERHGQFVLTPRGRAAAALLALVGRVANIAEAR